MTKVFAQRLKDGSKDLRRINKMFRGKSKVKVGFPKGSSEDILDRAAYNEFGTRKMPERPFMRNGLRDGVPEIKRASRTIAKRIVRGQLSAKQGLNQLGIKGKQLIQESITDLSDPANSPVTMQMKGSSNPLIDTGEMRGAVTYEVFE